MNKVIKTSHQINASADIIWGHIKKAVEWINGCLSLLHAN